MKHISQMEIHRISWCMLAPLLGLHFINIHGLTSLQLAPCSGFGNVRMTCVSLPAQGERHIALISPKNLHAMREKQHIRKLDMFQVKKKTSTQKWCFFLIQPKTNNPTPHNIQRLERLQTWEPEPKKSPTFQPSGPQAIDRNTNFGGNQHVVIHLGWERFPGQGTTNFQRLKDSEI